MTFLDSGTDWNSRIERPGTYSAPDQLTHLSASVVRLANAALHDKIVWRTLCAALFAIQALLVLSHEPWYDEWQALQIALGSPDIPALFANLRYEGHPPLWYALLRLTALAVPTGSVLAGLQLAIALSAQFLVLTRLRLPKVERLAFASSYVMLVEVGSLSRSLSLGALLLIAALTLKRPVLRWTAVALLPMADFQFGLASLAIIWLFAREKLISPWGLAFWLLSSLCAAWSVIPAPDTVPALVADETALDFLATNTALAPQLIPLHITDGRLQWGGSPPAYLGAIFGPVFLLMCDRILTASKIERLAFAGFALACVFFSIFVYRLSARHFAMLSVFLVLLKANSAARGLHMDGVSRVLWRGWLALGVMGGLLGTVVSLVQPFDSSAQAAAFIARKGLAQQPIVAWPEISAQGIAVNLRREFTGLTTGCTESFHRWNQPVTIRDHVTLSRLLRERVAQWGKFYFISEYNLAESKINVPLRQLGRVDGGYNGYQFSIYEVGVGRPLKGVPTVACAPSRKPIRDWWRD